MRESISIENIASDLFHCSVCAFVDEYGTKHLVDALSTNSFFYSDTELNHFNIALSCKQVVIGTITPIF